MRKRGTMVKSTEMLKYVGGGLCGIFVRGILFSAVLAFSLTAHAEVYYYTGFNNSFMGLSNWKNASNTSPTSFSSSDTFVLDRGTDGNNATTRLVGAFTFGGTLYAGYQDAARTGTLTYADTTARMSTKGSATNSVDTITFSKMYMGNLRINQWTLNTGYPLPSWAIFKGDIVFGDGTNGGNVLCECRANEGGQRNFVFADSLTGKGTFFMADTKNGCGVTLAGTNDALGKVDWTVRQGTLTVGQLADDTTKGLTANASRLGTGSTVTFSSNATIPQDNTNNIDYASSAENNTDKPALVFNTPTGGTSDNSTVNVTTVAGTKSTLTKNGEGTVLLGSVGVYDFQMYAGTLSNASNGTFSVTNTADIRGGTAVLNGADVNCAAGFYVGAYSNYVDGTTVVVPTDVTVHGSLVTTDLDIGVNAKSGNDKGETTAKFTMTGESLTVNGGTTTTLNWGHRSVGISGADRISNDVTEIDLSGVKTVSLTGNTWNMGCAYGDGSTWSSGVNVKLGTNNTITMNSLHFADSTSAGLYDQNTLELGNGTNILNVDSLLLGGYKSGNGTTGGATVSVPLGENDAKTGTVVIQGRTEGSKANLSMGRTGSTGMANVATVDLTNAASSDLTLGTLKIASYGGSNSYTAKLLLGENASLSADKILLGTSTKSKATLSIQEGTLDLYGPMTEVGTSVFTMDAGKINVHLASDSQLEQPLLSADTLTLTNDVLLDLLFDEGYQPSPYMPQATVFQTSAASMTALSDLVNGDWTKFFTPQTNYYFNFTSDGTHLYANIDGAAVPEPASWTLLLLGLGMGLRRRRL